MKESLLKNAMVRGFTLIELMIVIVILGVLMGTILPRLTGAQARARDTGRIADLNSISQALETYFDDYGSYPPVAGTTAVCLGAVADTVAPLLAPYLKGGVPNPPSSGQTTALLGATCTGTYLYAPLNNRGLSNNGYLLASDAETFQNANYITNASGVPLGLPAAVSAFTTVEGTASAMATADNDNEQTTVYILFN